MLMAIQTPIQFQDESVSIFLPLPPRSRVRAPGIPAPHLFRLSPSTPNRSYIIAVRRTSTLAIPFVGTDGDTIPMYILFM